MFSRNVVVLARRNIGPFPAFYKRIQSNLGGRNASQNMKLAAALWNTTKPKYGARNSPARAKEASRLYKKYGNRVITRSKAVKHTKKSPAKRRARVSRRSPKRRRSAKKKAAKSKKHSTARRAIKRRARRSTAKPNALTFTRYKHRITHRKLTTAQQTVLRATYGATSRLGDAARVTVGRRVLTDLKHRVTPAKRRQVRTARRHKGTYRSARRRPVARRAKTTKRGRKAKTTRKTMTSPQRRHATPYETFKNSVVRRAKLTPSKASTARVHRLWLLTNTQPHLSANKRVDMAVGLIRKSKVKRTRKVRKAHKRPAARRVSSSHRVKAVKKSTRKTKRSGRKHANPYIRFYREMMQTGIIPNSPRRTRTRRVKALWASTNHLKTIEARIGLGKAYLTGAQTMPSKQAAGKTTKPTQRKASGRTQKAAKPARLSFAVPPIYAVNPFSGAYAALQQYAPGTTPSTKMKHVAKAWKETTLPASKPDKRTPKQRIAAAAAALQRQ